MTAYMNSMNINSFLRPAGITLLVIIIAVPSLHGQIEGSLISLRRGALWTSFYPGKECLPFSNWTRISYGLDWPGFDPTWVGAFVGGPPSYLHTAGMWVGAKDDSGKIFGVEDWAMYAGTVTTEPGAKYTIRKHARRWPRGENYWLQKDSNEAEEVIDTEWEVNPAWIPSYTGERQLPVRITRTVRQWAGNQLDENYIIVEYIIRNISDSTAINEMYTMFTYALAPNTRGWSLLFPSYNAGARNVVYQYDQSRKMIFGYAEDSPSTTEVNEKYDYYKAGGPNGLGEYLAPANAGFRLLYSSPDTTGTASRINKVAWVAVPDAQDLYGPFGGASLGMDGRYGVLKDPTTVTEAATGSIDQRTTRRRWSIMSLGPFKINKKDSIRIVMAEFVAGASYSALRNPMDETTTGNQIGDAVRNAMNTMVTRTTMAYTNKNNVTDAPPSPDSVSILPPSSPKKIVNNIQWKNNVESIPDPDYTGAEALDLAGYRIYRSNYLPMGPWKLLVDIKKGDPQFMINASTYHFVDSTVVLGSGYYYSITSYDKGHSDWPITAVKDSVPPLESSIYASLYAKSSLDQSIIVRPYRATIPSSLSTDSILVVPNPFVLASGSLVPDEASIIKFVHVPSPAVLRIYTMRGDLVTTIRHDDGSGIIFWNQQTDYGQFVGSGVYL
jgi:hypothetical protein